MHHTDESFATMLLMSQITPSREELARPLSTSEWHQLRQRTREARMSMGQLVTLDMSGFMMKLDMTEQEAYRLCLLLGRALPLSMCLEQFSMSGIDVITFGDPQYPARLRDRLADKAPPMLYMAGRSELLRHNAIAILGSLSARGKAEGEVRALARLAASEGYTIVTDGTTGLSRIAQDEAVAAGGHVVEVTAGGLSARVEQPDLCGMLAMRKGTAISVVHPDALQTSSHALARNKLVYALSDAAFVFAAEKGRGTTYEGVVEALRKRWVNAIYVWDTPLYEGNRTLIAKGGIPFTHLTQAGFAQLVSSWRSATAEQLCMFDRVDPLA
ncbi:MAG: DNA-processing protein DprA [Clostridia bacterium]